MILLRRLIGDVLRRQRLRQSRTLRDVSKAAQVSLGYLSEVERGRKEASSELLAAICAALDVSLADVLREVSEDMVALERPRVAVVPAMPAPVEPDIAPAAPTTQPAATGSVASVSSTFVAAA